MQTPSAKDKHFAAAPLRSKSIQCFEFYIALQSQRDLVRDLCLPAFAIAGFLAGRGDSTELDQDEPVLDRVRWHPCCWPVGDIVRSECRNVDDPLS